MDVDRLPEYGPARMEESAREREERQQGTCVREAKYRLVAASRSGISGVSGCSGQCTVRGAEPPTAGQASRHVDVQLGILSGRVLVARVLMSAVVPWQFQTLIRYTSPVRHQPAARAPRTPRHTCSHVCVPGCHDRPDQLHLYVMLYGSTYLQGGVRQHVTGSTAAHEHRLSMGH